MKCTLVFAKCMLLSALFLGGCKKSKSGPAFTPGFDIYMTGESNDNAVYWKNGDQVSLLTNATGKAIAVAGNNIYVAGQSNATIQGKYTVLPVIWKNGSSLFLTTTETCNITGIGLRGDDVYVLGSLGKVADFRLQRPVYWINSYLQDLAPTSVGSANAIAFSGTDVYIAGSTGITAQPWDSVFYWKNNVILPFVTVGNNNALLSIAINGADIFSVGRLYDKAIIFKNGQSINLEDPYNRFSTATGIAVVGSDVYVAGVIYDSNGTKTYPVYWKNGKINILEKNYPDGNAYGIAVAGNDVYVVGSVYTPGKNIPVYWKNGVQQSLGTSGIIYSIFVSH